MRLACPLALLLAAIFALVGCAATPAPLPPKAIALNEEGAEALGAGNTEIAEARLALALEYNPRFTEAWVNLGLVALKKHDWAAARSDFEPDTYAAAWQLLIEGRAAEDVAKALGKSRNAVYVAKSRVLSRVRHILKELGEWDEG